MSLQCKCDGGFEGTDDASKVGFAAKIGGYTMEKFCAICTPGKYGQHGTDTCNPCQPGFYQPDSGKQSCIPTDKGFFQNASGGIKQFACTPGYYNPATVMEQCLACS